jgi:hypothetical protein
MIGQEAAESVHRFNLLYGDARIRLENFTTCLTTWKKYDSFFKWMLFIQPFAENKISLVFNRLIKFKSIGIGFAF